MRRGVLGKLAAFLMLAAWLPTAAAASSETRSFRAVVLKPKWQVEDFSSRETFEGWMRGQMEAAKPYLSSDRENLVVLTEFNGLPLLLQDSSLARRTGALLPAMGVALFKRLPQTVGASIGQGVGPVRGLSLSLAPLILQRYVPLCRELAVEYRVWLVCGSAPLPHLERTAGGVRIAGSEVYNEALVFRPDGRLVGAADKVHLTSTEEMLDLTAGRLEDLRVFPTPVGDLGIAICLDAFKDDVIANLEVQGATVLVQPSANSNPWTGEEQGVATHRLQPVGWLEGAWERVQRSPTLRYGLNPMVVGNLLDSAFDGQSAIVAKADYARDQRAYVLTEPRPGFLTVAPWVAEGEPARLQEIGGLLAPGSGDKLENAYREDVLWADLQLPATLVAERPLRPFELALDGFASDRARLEGTIDPWPVLWPLLWLAVLAGGVVLLRRRGLLGRALGVVVALLGAAGAVLALG
jgi:predicted amidohydrolase